MEGGIEFCEELQCLDCGTAFWREQAIIGVDPVIPSA
jgi:hypothetical protein